MSQPSISYSEASSLPNSSGGDSPERMCWICYSTDRDETLAGLPSPWIHPCRCCGSSKWVHTHCLQRWLDEQYRQNPTAPLACRMCGYNYVVQYPPCGILLEVLDRLDSLAEIFSAYAFSGALACTLYWSATTYGALTVMQVCGGCEAGVQAMANTDSLVLFFALPAIPTLLVSSNLLLDWESWLLRLWRARVYRSPLFLKMLPRDLSRERLEDARQSDGGDTGERVTITRRIIMSLLLPTIAIYCGQTAFPRIGSRVGQILAGGALYLGVSGVLRMYRREMTFLRQCRRSIVEYNGE